MLEKLTLKTFKFKLTENKYRITNSRVELLEVLLKHKHLSVQELSNKLVQPNISTLYNNLCLFEKLNFVGSVKYGNKKLYELLLSDHTHDNKFHGHLIDKKGRIYDIDVNKEIKVLKKKFKN